MRALVRRAGFWADLFNLLTFHPIYRESEES